MTVDQIDISTVYFRIDDQRHRTVFQILSYVSRFKLERIVYWFDADENNKILYISTDTCYPSDFIEIPHLKPIEKFDKRNIIRLLFQCDKVIDRSK